MSDSTFEYNAYRFTGIILIDFPGKLKEPYRTKYAGEKNNPYYILQKKGRLLHKDIGKLESPDIKTLKLTFKKEATQEDIEYFRDLLEKLIERDKRNQMAVEGNISKYEY